MPSRPRVLHLSPTHFDPGSVLGGAERYCLELAQAMSCRVPTRLVSFGSSGSVRETGNLEIRILRAFRMKRDPLNPLAAGLFRELAWADVVHLHQFHSIPADLAMLLGLLSGRRVFATDLGGGARYALSYHLPLPRAVRAFLAITDYAASFPRQRGWPVRTIGGGVDAGRFSPAAREHARERTALFVGRLLPHKGLEDLIDAAGPALPVRILGSHRDEAFLRHLAAMARGKPVRFELGLSDEDLVEAYRSSAVTVLPSVEVTRDGRKVEKSELLGQTLLESMACGTPVVCTRVGGMPEVVEGSRAGTVVPPSDPAALGRALLTWLDAPADVRGEAGRAGRRWVLERFSWDAVVVRCLEAYAA